MADAVPFPLPDLPRAPESDLGLLACRILEHRDIGALTRLPDMLMDVGREEDAGFVREMLARSLYENGDRSSFQDTWREFIPDVARVLWWDIFSWEGTLAVMAKELAPKEEEPATARTKIDHDRTTTVLHAAGETLPESWAGSSTYLTARSPGLAGMTVAEAHAREMHPDYDYSRTDWGSGHRGEGWEVNQEIPRDRVSYYWRRRRVPLPL